MCVLSADPHLNGHLLLFCVYLRERLRGVLDLCDDRADTTVHVSRLGPECRVRQRDTHTVGTHHDVLEYLKVVLTHSCVEEPVLSKGLDRALVVDDSLSLSLSLLSLAPVLE